MLPFDNKSEFQVMINAPEGTTLEETAAIAQEMGSYLGSVSEVVDYQIYAGTSGPFNFNGLVRHYFLRRGANVADIQVNLKPKHERSEQSHGVAKRVRPRLNGNCRAIRNAHRGLKCRPARPCCKRWLLKIYRPDYERQIEVAQRGKNDL